MNATTRMAALAAAKPKLEVEYRNMRYGHINAKRFYAKHDGFSGWVVQNERDRNHVSDPITNRTDAVRTMREMHDMTTNPDGSYKPMRV